ncbi:MAG: CvpA family protein [Clostridia bacterium]|nr:CvpA family protein [Clostridia bacterium]
MSLVIDVLLLAIILVAVIVGYKKGFIKISVVAVGFVVSFIVAITLSTTVANYVYDTFLQDKMVSTVSSSLEKQGNVAIDTAVDNIFSSDKMIIKMAKICNITADDIKPQLNAESSQITTVSQYIEGEVIKPTMTFMLRVIFLILLFIICSILFNLLSNLLSKTFSLTVAKKADPIVGGMLGFIIGIVIVFILTILLDTVISLFPDGIIGISTATRDGSYVYRFVNSISNWNI